MSEVVVTIQKDLWGRRWPGRCLIHRGWGDGVREGLLVQMEKTRTGGERAMERGSIPRTNHGQRIDHLPTLAVCRHRAVPVAQPFGLGLSPSS